MPKIYFRLAASCAMLFGLLVCCLHSNSFAQRLIYRVDLDHAKDGYIGVTLQPMEVRPDTMIFQMPVWTPGIYSEVHYGRFIHDFEAVDTNGRSLTVKQLTPDCWKIIGASNIREIRYRVEDSHNDASSPAIGLASIQDNAIVANTEAIFGYLDNDKSIPATIIFTAPKDWKIATSLDPATEDDLSLDERMHQLVYDVDGYEDLADAPLFASPDLKTSTFTLNNVNYMVVSDGNRDFPIDSFAAAASKIVRAETSFYRQIPYDDYMFFVYDRNGSGHPFGLAHSASSVYELNEDHWPVEPSDIQHLIAATFFQTWNGKRFHISPLGPIDFSAPCGYTNIIDTDKTHKSAASQGAPRSLWFSEGVSDYYADLLMVRYGIISPPEFFNDIDRLQTEAVSTPPLSLEELSAKEGHYDASRCNAVRCRGAMTALLLDLEIRSRTHNRRSLDNVLLRMNADVQSGKTYDDKLLIKTIAKYASVNLDTFYNHYIAGNEALPVEEYLAMMGAGRELPQSMELGGSAGLDLALNAAGTAIIDAVPADTLLEAGLLRKGDTIAAIDNVPVTPVALAAMQRRIVEGQPVMLRVVRNSKPVEVTVKSKQKARRLPLIASKKAAPKQLAMRKSLIGKRRLVKPKHS
jgi:predicted metalloprotease with PDZ domain